MSSQKSAQELKKARCGPKRVTKRKNDALTLELIDRLLDDNLPALSQEYQPPDILKKEATQELSEILDAAPGYKLLNPGLFCRIFSENGLKLTSFVPPDVKLYNHSANTLHNDLFRKLIMGRAHMLRVDALDNGASLYVLYLMSCATRPHLVRSCYKFLHAHPVNLTPSDVMCLLLNLGVDSSEWPTQLDGQREGLATCQQGSPDFPYLNIDTLVDYLSFCVEEGRIPCDASCQPILSLLSKMGLDRQIRGRTTHSRVSNLLSLLARRCTDAVGPDLVADWLLSPHDHHLNQLEVCRQLVWPCAALRHSLLTTAITRVLGTDVAAKMGRSPRLEPRDLRAVVRACTDPKYSPLKLFTAFHLLTSILPEVTLTGEDFKYLDNLLMKIKSRLGNRDLADDIKLRGAAMQLRSLLRLANVANLSQESYLPSICPNSRTM